MCPLYGPVRKKVVCLTPSLSEKSDLADYSACFRWMLEDSIIGANPGMGIRPKFSDLKIDSSLYLLNGRDGDLTPSNKEGEGERNADFARRMELFMKGYKNTSKLNECVDNNDRVSEAVNNS